MQLSPCSSPYDCMDVGLYGGQFSIPSHMNHNNNSNNNGEGGGFMFETSSSSSTPLLNNLHRRMLLGDRSVAGGVWSCADGKTMLALKNHKEAEKRRRERINCHLDRLRSKLPCSAKTDKATLLAKVVQRVRELDRETTDIMTRMKEHEHFNTNNIPSEVDGYSVDPVYSSENDDMIVKASLCCEDRSDLFSDLSQVVKGLNLKTVRAEMLSLGGRTSNVLVLSGERGKAEEYVTCLHDALKGIVQRSGPSDRLKRRRRVEMHGSHI